MRKASLLLVYVLTTIPDAASRCCEMAQNVDDRGEGLFSEVSTITFQVVRVNSLFMFDMS